MKEILQRLTLHEKLSRAEAAQILTNITQEKYPPEQVASFVTVFLMRSISVEELSGFRDALLELCIQVDTGDMQSIDVCGTGGDGKNTFNISTVSSFVVAGAGYKVTKHGNKSVSSNCGSSDVLQSLGYTFTNDRDTLLKQLDQANICYLHAPFFHPALKSVGPIRKALRLKTFFNMLGPLVNPASPSHQLVGVFDLKLLRLYEALYRDIDTKHTILHGMDGYDEISLTAPTKVTSHNRGAGLIGSSDIGLSDYQQEDLYGGETIEDAKNIFVDILDNKGTPAQRDVVLANSAMAIDCFKEQSDLSTSLAEAKESLASGKARGALQKLLSLT